MPSSTAEALAEHIVLDTMPSPGGGVCVDFGVRGDSAVFGALQWGYKHAAFALLDLEEAAGDGARLTELVNRRGEEGRLNPYARTIRTLWDELRDEEE